MHPCVPCLLLSFAPSVTGNFSPINLLPFASISFFSSLLPLFFLQLILKMERKRRRRMKMMIIIGMEEKKKKTSKEEEIPSRLPDYSAMTWHLPPFALPKSHGSFTGTGPGRERSPSCRAPPVPTGWPGGSAESRDPGWSPSPISATARARS